MPDKLADILKNDLAIEDQSLQDLLLEVLDLCQPLQDPRLAILKLESKIHKISSNVDQLKKLPYCQLFLAYVYFSIEEIDRAAKTAAAAISGFDQLDHVWNRSIAHWISGLIYKKAGNLDDAEWHFEAAISLMTQALQDHKRRSRYGMAGKCAVVLGKIHADAQPPNNTSLTYQLPLRSSESAPVTQDPEIPSSEENEGDLFQDLLHKVGGDVTKAESLIETEGIHAPGASRLELIRMAIERWERDNQ